jgi:VWFA-related protein
MTVLSLAFSLAVLAQPVAPAAELVRIDVVATVAKAGTVGDLKPSDFELREDGILQTIEEARFVKIDQGVGSGAEPAVTSAEVERAEAARDGTRLLAIYLDDYHVSAANAPRLRSALNRFVDEELGPRDLVTILRPLDSLLSIRLTRDRAALHRVIDAFEGRRGDYEPRTDFERNYMANTPERADLQRAQATWSTLSALAIHMGNLASGRKTILLASEVAVPVASRRGLEGLATFASVVRSANRSNVAIYVIDAREEGEGHVAEESDVRRALAAETNGETIANANDLESGLRQMWADSSAYYLLTYRSAKSSDGQFHGVEVRVKRPSVRLRARKGHWAANVDEIQRAAMLSHANDPKPAVPLEPARHLSPLIRPWFGETRGEAGKTRVTFVWEPVGRLLGERNRRAVSRLVLKVLGGDGSTVFEGPVLPATSLLGGPADDSARAVFDVTPGRLRLRMSIEDAAAQAVDSDVRDLLVRDLRTPVALGTPEVLRARTARDVRLIDENADAVPVASREFSRTEQLVVRFPVYAPPGAEPALTVRLLNRAGRPMRELAVRDAPDGRRQIDLPLAGLAASDYSIEITVTSSAGQARDTVAFRVTP